MKNAFAIGLLFALMSPLTSHAMMRIDPNQAARDAQRQETEKHKSRSGEAEQRRNEPAKPHSSQTRPPQSGQR